MSEALRVRSGPKPERTRFSNSGDLLETTHVHIEHMDAGQRFTIPIAYRQNQNISYRWLSQIPSKDREKAELEWWMSYQTTNQLRRQRH